LNRFIFGKSAFGALYILLKFCYDSSIHLLPYLAGGPTMRVQYPSLPSNPLLKVALSLLIIIFTACLLLNLYLDPIVTSLFRQQIGTLFDQNLSIDSIHLSLWQGSLILNKVSLKQPKNFGTGSMIAADHIKIRLKLLPLFQKQLLINSITLVRPHVHWVQKLYGATNFEYYTQRLRQASQPAAAASQSSKPLSIDLKKLSIIDGTLSFSSPRIAAKQPAFTLKDIQIRITDFQLPNPGKNPAQFHIKGTMDTPHPGRFECSGKGIFFGETLEFSAKNRFTEIHLPDYGYLYPQSQLTVIDGNASIEGNIHCRNNYITSTQQVNITGLKVVSAKKNVITRSIMGISANTFIQLLNDNHQNLKFQFEVQGPTSQLKIHLKENITRAVLKSLNRKLGLNKDTLPQLPNTLQESGRKLKNKLNSLFGK